MYDIIIVGAGPAGLTAALYARRAEKSVLVIERDTFGGQMTHSPRIENYPGFVALSGNELADKLIEQVFAQGAEIELDCVTDIKENGDTYTVVCEGASYEAKAVIIAAGSSHRTLGLEGEDELVGHGISYCAVCDGAFYKDKTVAVIGGGNSALGDASLLQKTAKKIYIIQNLTYLTGESALASRLEAADNVEIIFSASVTALNSQDGELCGITVSRDGIEEDISIDGMFVAIGQKPENEPFRSVCDINEYGYIVSDESCSPSGSRSGIFTAGDCRTKAVRQISTATADGAIAALAACKYIDSISNIS